MLSGELYHIHFFPLCADKGGFVRAERGSEPYTHCCYKYLKDSIAYCYMSTASFFRSGTGGLHERSEMTSRNGSREA
jgi:hypothetical protein